MMKTPFVRTLLISCFSLTLLAAAHAQQLQVTQPKPDGVYAPGEKIVWEVKAAGTATPPPLSAHYQIKRAGGNVVSEGTVDLAGGIGHIETTQTEPLTYLADIETVGADGKKSHVFGGAVVAPSKITPSLPRPADFDAFWKANVAALKKVPMEPVLEPGDSGRAGVDYWKVTLNNVDGAKVHAQMARPHTGTKFPALIVLQWAGVYGLNKAWVTNRAAEGWLVINVMPHDLPLDETPEFYKKAADTTLRDYATQGNDRRETSYLRKMVLGCVRSADYLCGRPDWDGKTLVATGTSQGGFQSIALTDLEPRVTAMMVNVPAGCDHAANVTGRGVPWPWWNLHTTNGNNAAVLEAGRYYDNVNFAYGIRVPSLVAFGLIDTVSPPTGVLAMANQIKGPKEAVFMVLSDHQGEGGKYQRDFQERSNAWLNAIRMGQAPPLRDTLSPH